MRRMMHKGQLRPAYTLIELVLSMAIMTLLLGGLASAMMIASRAVPDRSTTLGATLDSAYAADQLAAELLTAKSFTVRTSTAVEFMVADRNNDGADEIIRYQWSGAPGASLTRRYNADLAVTVVSNVNEFALLYDVATMQHTTQPGPNESGETLLAAYSATTNLVDWPTADKKYIGECFGPALPADATSWKVTRAGFMTRIHGANKGLSRVQMQTANAGNQPSGTILEEHEMLESELSAGYLEKYIAFTNVSGLTPGTRLCLVVMWLKDAHACDVQYQGSGATPSNANLVVTADGGKTWTSAANQSMLFEVYGTITAPSTPVVTQQYYVTRVRIKLRAGNNAEARAETSAQILNEPEIMGP